MSRKEPIRGRAAAWLTLSAFLAVWLAGAVVYAANPTLEDISRSFENRLDQKPSSGNYTAILLGTAAVVGVLILAGQWGRRQDKPRVTNHTGRLLREMRKSVHLSRSQIKRLKAAADRRACSSPLTIVLCPSLLQKNQGGAKPPQTTVPTP